MNAIVQTLPVRKQVLNTVTGKPIHSRLGPSSAHRWLNCTGSVRIIKEAGLDEEDTSEYAAKGTVCHNVAAQCLMTGKEAWEFCGKHFKEAEFDFEFDEEMAAWTDIAIQAVRTEFRKWEHLGAILYVETQVSSEYDEEAYGTADIRIEVPGVVLIIMDFKFGWVRVDPDDEQLRLYGTYAYEMRSKRLRGDGEPQEIKLCIIQPRLPDPKEHVRWNNEKIIPKELEDWFFGHVLMKMAETRDPNAPLTMGDHCKFCPANTNGKCPALMKESETLNIDSPLGTVSNERLNELANKAKNIEKFLKGIFVEMTQRAKMGHNFDDWKLVDKYGDREFYAIVTEKNEAGEEIEVNVREALIAALGDDAFEPLPTERKLKSPAQMEKTAGGKKLVARYAYKPNSGQTIASKNDNRKQKKGMMAMLDAQQEKQDDIVY